MKFEGKHVLDKPAATVIGMYTDRRFFERKYQDLGAWDVEVLEHEKSDTRFRIKCRYTIKNRSGSIPAFAQKFVGDSSTLIQQDTWDIKARTGLLEVEIKGVPVKVLNHMTLRDAGAGSVNAMKWEVSCGIPLIGGKLEQFVAEDIKAKSANDEKVTVNILADYS